MNQTLPRLEIAAGQNWPVWGVLLTTPRSIARRRRDLKARLAIRRLRSITALDALA